MGFSHIRPFSVLLILALVALLFGGRRLRDLGGDLAEGIKTFRRAFQDEDSNDTPPTHKPSEPSA